MTAPIQLPILPYHRRAAVTFLIGSPELDPLAVSSALDIAPTHMAIPGATLETWDGRVVHEDRVGWWALSTTDLVASFDVATHFKFLLDRLLPYKDIIREFGRGGEVFFEVPWPVERSSEFDPICRRGAEALGAYIEFLGEE